MLEERISRTEEDVSYYQSCGSERRVAALKVILERDTEALQALREWKPEEKPSERQYLIVGTEDGIQSSIWPESKLHRGVLSTVFYEPDDCSQEEAEYWYDQLRCDANWSHGRAHFHQGIGEVAHLDIYLITDSAPTGEGREE